MEPDSSSARIGMFRIIVSVLGGAVFTAMLWLILSGKYGIILSQSIKGFLILGVICILASLLIYALTKPPKTSVAVGAAERQVVMMQKQLRTLEKKR